MKIIINENERGMLFKNGVYQKILGPGKQKIKVWKGETVEVVDAKGGIFFVDMNLPVLMKDKEFKDNVAYIEVPDDKLAIRFVDGRISRVLSAGEYAYWNIYERNTFKLLDMNDSESINELPDTYIKLIQPEYYAYCTVEKGEVGLLFYDGVYQKTLESGKYFFWTYKAKPRVEIVDMRLRQLNVTGQEVLTADKVSLRINFVCTYTVIDPVKVITEIEDYEQQIYVLAQLILRELAGKYRFDELLREKENIAGMVYNRLKEKAAQLFVEFSGAGIKDIILPGEVRDIMNTVLVAEKNAQASVITRREETAATKSLLNTAKLMDENTTLFKLKELEYIERVCDKVENISLGSDGILNNLRELISTEPR